MKPSKHKMTVLSQFFKLIPRNLIPKTANDFGIDRQSRVFSPTSHVFALVFGQFEKKKIKEEDRKRRMEEFRKRVEADRAKQKNVLPDGKKTE